MIYKCCTSAYEHTFIKHWNSVHRPSAHLQHNKIVMLLTDSPRPWRNEAFRELDQWLKTMAAIVAYCCYHFWGFASPFRSLPKFVCGLAEPASFWKRIRRQLQVILQRLRIKNHGETKWWENDEKTIRFWGTSNRRCEEDISAHSDSTIL